MILFSDFDKTLYFRDDDGRTIANIQAIEKWRATGNLFCITTGRSYESVTKQMPEIKDLCDCYIVDSGSIVLSKDGEVLNTFYFKPETIEGIANLSKTFSEVPALFYYTPNSEGLEYKTNGVTKLRLWFKNTSLLHDINEEMIKQFPVFAVYNSDYGVRPSISGLEDYRGFIEVIPLESGKSNAIKFLAQSKGFSLQEIVTIGDGLNDLEMVRDFDGFAIEGSKLSSIIRSKTTPSLAELVESKLNNGK